VSAAEGGAGARPGERVPPRRLRKYLTGALKEIRGSGVCSGEVDWEAVRREAEPVLASAGAYSDLHPFLADVLGRAGGRHSHLVTRETLLKAQARLAAGGAAALPRADLVDGAGVVTLPHVLAGRRFLRRYADVGAAAVADVAARRPRGWIVDIRRNQGGDMWSMLAVLAGLLERGELGYFSSSGTMQPWSLGRRHVLLGHRPMARHRGRSLRAAGVPLAVLVSARTASSAEAVTIALRGQSPARAFGTPTAGLTTANRTHVLSDGTRLLISSAYCADRHRNRVTDAIEPDERVDGDDPGAAQKAAQKWINEFR
jgi:carboxyl-terminal processing protease